MHTRKFGNTDMEITPIGIGAWALGGGTNLGNRAGGLGSQYDTQAIETIQRGLELGINWIDTAAIYSFGHSEEIVGKAIRGRKQPYIFTKCSMVWDESFNTTNNLHANSIRHECEASLKRLNVDAIDLYQIHWPAPDEDLEEGWSTLATLKQEGKVRHIGVSNFSLEQMKRVEKIAPIEALQPPYSLIHPEAEKELLPYGKENNIGALAYSPMATGLLTGRITKSYVDDLPDGDWRKQHAEYQEPRLSRNLALVDLLAEIGCQHNVQPSIVAIAWVLSNPAVTGAIVGSHSIAQIEEIVTTAEFGLSETELDRINTFITQRP